MAGALLLAGSGEFTRAVVAVDRALLRHTPGTPPRVAIVPTASGLEGAVPLDWIARGVRHFGALGCAAFGVPILNCDDADRPEHREALAGADLIYLSGGNPRHLVASLAGSAAWAAIRAAWSGGATLAGSSAGAMALGELTIAPFSGPPSWVPALGLLPGIGILPHYDRFGSARTAPLVAVASPELAIVGIDEDTAILVDPIGRATVLGAATATLLRGDSLTVVAAGAAFPDGVIRPAIPAD
jgi:cyanophycinase